MSEFEKIKTIPELKQYNKNAGKFYFSPATMRFFQSKVESNPVYIKDGLFFITSEEYTQDGCFISRVEEAYPRLYTIRKMLKSGEVDSVSEFQEFETLNDATESLDYIYELEYSDL